MAASLFEPFLALHQQETPLLMPNPWDVGSAKIFESLGFAALATTSSGFAGTLGRLDGALTRDQVLEHASVVAAAVTIPVSADLENCFADDPAGVAETVRLATETGLAGCSVEDYRGPADEPIYDRELAADRVRAAAEAAHSGPKKLVLTGRAENYLRGVRDLTDTIERLQSYQEAGADVLFAPGVTDLDELHTLVAAVDRPVNVLPFPGTPPVAELTAIGVKRISIGSGFYGVAIAAFVEAAIDFRDHGTYAYWSTVPTGMAAARAAFAD